MKRFNYKIRYSPYSNSIMAKNYKDAWEKLSEAYPEYNVKEVVEYLCYN